MTWIAPALLAAVHLAIVAVAWRIRRGSTWMLSGYRPERVLSETGLARWMGTGLLLIGAVGIVAAGMLAVAADYAAAVLVAYCSAVLTGAVILARGARRFLAPAERQAG